MRSPTFCTSHNIQQDSFTRVTFLTVTSMNSNCQDLDWQLIFGCYMTFLKTHTKQAFRLTSQFGEVLVLKCTGISIHLGCLHKNSKAENKFVFN